MTFEIWNYYLITESEQINFSISKKRTLLFCLNLGLSKFMETKSKTIEIVMK